MIIVSSYADGIRLRTGKSSIRDIDSLSAAMFPKEVGFHLLPFFLQSGDGGFAINDWFEVRQDLGTWADIATLAAHRPLMVDGVYNHVGIEHKWVAQFWESPEAASQFLHAYLVKNADVGPMSPRGSSVLRPYRVAGRTWHLWQTFPPAVDINLTSTAVLEEIERHLDFIALQGIWGIRIDAPAYYAKKLGGNIRHNPGAQEITSTIADMISRRGMRVLGQLDCDPPHLEYLAKPSERGCARYDFSYSAYLAIALLLGDPRPLAEHSRITASVGKLCLRSPRTHDGILLRSIFIKPWAVELLREVVESHGANLRYEANRPYEVNCSGPYMYSLSAHGQPVKNLIELAVAITGILPGWAYYYLPFIFGYAPELSEQCESSSDPRALNRSAVPISVVEEYNGSEYSSRINGLIAVLSKIHDESPDQIAYESPGISVIDDVILCLETSDKRYKLIANFSAQGSMPIGSLAAGEMVYSHQCSASAVEPFGYGLWQLF